MGFDIIGHRHVGHHPSLERGYAGGEEDVGEYSYQAPQRAMPMMPYSRQMMPMGMAPQRMWGMHAMTGQSPLEHGPRGALYHGYHADAMRRQPLPLPATSIAAGALSVINIFPQRAYRPDRLILRDGLDPNVSLSSVTDISIAQRSQLPAPGQIPISLFAATAFDSFFRFETAYPGIQINISILNGNPGPGPITYTGSFLGESAQV